MATKQPRKIKTIKRTTNSKKQSLINDNNKTESIIDIDETNQPITHTIGNIKINQNMLAYMQSIKKLNTANHEIKNEIFVADNLPYLNSSIRGNNFYMLDKYGLPIRKKEQNNIKPAFGWKYDDNHDPINIHINPILIKTNSPDIQIITLKYLKEHYPNQFKSSRGIIYKICQREFPDIDLSTL